MKAIADHYTKVLFSQLKHYIVVPLILKQFLSFHNMSMLEILHYEHFMHYRSQFLGFIFTGIFINFLDRIFLAIYFWTYFIDLTCSSFSNFLFYYIVFL